MSRWNHSCIGPGSMGSCPVLALALLASIALAAGARAEVPEVRWLVPAEGDLPGWRAAAAATWPSGLSVRSWSGAWPPTTEDTGLHAEPVAFIEGAPADGVLVIRAPDGGERRIPVRLPDAARAEAMKSVLLILRSTVAPLEVEAEPEPVLLPPPEDLENVEVEAPAERRPGRVRGGLATGLTTRPGLDRLSLRACGRLGLVLGPVERGLVRIVVYGGADFLLGRTYIGGIPAREDEVFAGLGLEVRPAWNETRWPLSLGGGVRYFRGIRTDRADAKPDEGVVPEIWLNGGPSWQLTDRLVLEVRLAVNVETIRLDMGPPIQLRLTAGDQIVPLDLVNVRVGLQVGLDLGEPAPPARRGGASRKPDNSGVRSGEGRTPNR